MNIKRIITAIVTHIVLASNTFADEPKELLSLRQSWEKARQQATAPIDKRYGDTLAALKSRFTKEGKLDAALAVDSEIKRIAPPEPSTIEKGASLIQRLNGTTWKSKTGDEKITFENDRLFWINSAGIRAPGSYSLTEDGKRGISYRYGSTGGQVKLEFARSLEEFHITDGDRIFIRVQP